METILHEPARVDLLATVAHELRNPLAAIQVAVRILDSHEPTSRSRKEARASIDRQVLRIARLSDDLLDAGYLASGKPELRTELTAIPGFICVSAGRADRSAAATTRRIVTLHRIPL